jgi:hypothetical protein
MEALLHGALAWLASHPVEDILGMVYVAMVVVAHLPASLAKKPWIGAVHRVLDRLSALAHATDDASFKVPGFASDAVKAVMEEAVK